MISNLFLDIDLDFLYAFLHVQLILALLYIIAFQFLQRRFLLSQQNLTHSLASTDLKSIKLDTDRNSAESNTFGVTDYLQSLEQEIEKIESILHVSGPDSINFDSIDANSLELPLVMRYLFLSAERETLLNSNSEKQYLKNIHLSFYRIFKIIESLLLKDLCQEGLPPPATQTGEQTDEQTGEQKGEPEQVIEPTFLNTEEKISYYEERIETLDHFRNLFFELQDDYGQLENKYQTILNATKQHEANPTPTEGATENINNLFDQAKEDLLKFDFKKIKEEYEERLARAKKEGEQSEQSYQSLIEEQATEKLQLTRSISKLKTENKTLKDELMRFEKKADTLDKVKSKLHRIESSLESAREENARLQNELTEKDKSIIVLENQKAYVEQLRGMIRTHTNEAKTMVSRIFKISDENKKLSSKYSALNKKYNELLSKNESLHNNYKSQQRIQNLESELELAARLKKQGETEILEAKNAIKSLENENARLRKEITLAKASTDSSLDHSTTDQYKNAIAEKDKELTKLRQEVQSLEKQFFSLVRRK